uniref:HMG box domain-containing protein n=1 Tax=Anopheles melas TaxID=34690 RepID=A0A182TY81_9DIPT
MALPANYKHNIPGPPMPPQRLRPSGSAADRKDNSSPFMHNPHGNPAFNPQKMGKASAASESKMIKPPKPPEKPLMPYMRYSRKVWDSIKASNSDLKLWEVGKIIGQQWRLLPESEKEEYIAEYELEKAEHEKNMKAYHNSPAYLAYLTARNKVKPGDGDGHEPSSRSSSKGGQADRRIDIQPAEDEDDPDDGYSFKHVAYARFSRNHRLINEIFSDAVVPDVRSVVTTQRMHVLKRQVQSLTMHQMKLQHELQLIEEKFETRKRKFVESSETFQDELKKHCKPAVDEETFGKMVDRQYEMMKRDRLRALEEAQKPPAPVPTPAPTQPPAAGPPKPESEAAPDQAATASESSTDGGAPTGSATEANDAAASAVATPRDRSPPAAATSDESQGSQDSTAGGPPQPSVEKMDTTEDPKPDAKDDKVVAAAPKASPEAIKEPVTPAVPNQPPVVPDQQVPASVLTPAGPVPAPAQAAVPPPAPIVPTPPSSEPKAEVPPTSTVHHTGPAQPPQPGTHHTVVHGGYPPHAAPVPSAPAIPPPHQAPVVPTPPPPSHTPEAQVPPPNVTVPHHQPPPHPPPHHMPPHMQPHPGMPGHGPSFPGYPHAGSPRAPYYLSSYGGHPQPYGQYGHYPYHQQYAPPPPPPGSYVRPPGGPPGPMGHYGEVHPHPDAHHGYGPPPPTAGGSVPPGGMPPGPGGPPPTMVTATATVTPPTGVPSVSQPEPGEIEPEKAPAAAAAATSAAATPASKKRKKGGAAAAAKHDDADKKDD